MNTPSDIIIELEKVSGRKDKEKIISDAWDQKIYNFFEGAKMAYDPLITFGIKQVPLIEDEDDLDFKSEFSWNKFKNIANQLQTRSLTGNKARDTLRAAANIADIKEWNYFYRRILLKDFKCGCSESTINKVLNKKIKDGDVSASQYLIPVFSVQLAKNADDHPKKMKGKKLFDPKYDGVRLLTVLNKEDNTVKQYTRNGLENINFKHITKGLEKLLPIINESLAFDSEVISKNFQDMMKQLNRKKDVNTDDAILAIFDCLPWKDFLNGQYNVTQSDRHKALAEFQPLFDQYLNGSAFVIPKIEIDLDTDEGQKAFKEFNKECIDAGYEGIMAKDPYAPYVNDRTDSWLKLKPFITVDLEIIGYEPGKPEGEHANTLGGLICKGIDQGKTIEVTVGSGFSDELRNEIWNNKQDVIGRIAEIKGDKLTLSQDGSSWSIRFPTFMQFRGWNPGEKI